MFFEYTGFLENTFLELSIFRWIHILAMSWWLGGEWGVFHASSNVVNEKLSYDERKRALSTAFQIDVMPRSMIIVLPLIGMHLGALHGVSPVTGVGLIITWVLFLSWIGLINAAFIYKNTEFGWKLTMLDERIRYVFIPLLLFFGGYGLFTGTLPSINIFTGDDFLTFVSTAKWFAIKIFLFGLLLIIGLSLRIIMRRWVVGFSKLKEFGSTPETEMIFGDALKIGRKLAYLYWIGIATVAFFGVSKIIV